MFSNNKNNKTKHGQRHGRKTVLAGDWNSFWDLSDPETVSVAMLELYGAAAANAASNCAAAAMADSRSEDYRFWTIALTRIEAAQQRRREVAVARWEADGLALI